MTSRLKRIKAYKAKSPEETVKNIKAILNGLGLHLVETTVEGNSFFRACRLSIINPNNKQIIFTTSGKGSSPEWASASAWGEMIERIQNLAFYMIYIYPARPETKKVKGSDFNYFPEERMFKMISGVEREFKKEFRIITGIQNLGTFDREYVTGVPYYDLFEKESVYFPFRALQVIVGSNGMCSGNTCEEALLQGISEVFERYVLKSIYENPFCPPDIPFSYFRDTEIGNAILHLVQEQGLTIQIKDCSMNRGYPVIGVLVRDHQNSYAFHLGADPCPITALERCFTEMYQGGTICFQSMEELNRNLPYDLSKPFWKRNLSMTIKAYRGQWPVSVMENKPTYLFSGFNHPESVSDRDDLKYLLRILKNENRKIFIKDNSFLGQPAFHVYIPGMSEITSFPNNTFSNAFLEFDNYLTVLNNLKRSDIKSRKEMENLLQRYILSSPENQFIACDYFRFNQTHPVACLSSEQFLNLITFSLLEGEITDHYSISEIEANPFLNSVFKEKGVLKPEEIFHNLNIPDCFFCNDCAINSNCNLPYILSFWEKIKEKIRTCKLDQSSLLNLEND